MLTIKQYGNEHAANEVFEAVMAARSWHDEIEMVAKNGRRFPVLLRADAIKDKSGDVIVLMDLKLPRVDGLEVLRRFKEHPRIKLVPVVVLTSSSEDRDIATAYEYGANSGQHLSQ